MEAYRVFISSIMNPSIEDIMAEREQARAAVEHFSPVTKPWAFEAEPASAKPLLEFYIDAVKTSDLFVLVLGQHLTKPVQDEYNVARDFGKPMLVFAKTVTAREPNAADLLRSLNSKYDSFANAAELRQKVRRSVGSHLLSLIRGNGTGLIQPGDRLALLRSYVREHTPIKILPLVPPCEYNSFRVSEVGARAVAFQKDSNHQSVTIPAQRIADVLDVGSADVATAILDGRLQWLTIPQSWRFFAEKPATNDSHGLRLSKMPPSDSELAPRLKGLAYQWFASDNFPLLAQEGWTLFYDDDGRPLSLGGSGHLFVRSGGA